MDDDNDLLGVLVLAVIIALFAASCKPKYYLDRTIRADSVDCVHEYRSKRNNKVYAVIDSCGKYDYGDKNVTLKQIKEMSR